MYSSFWRAVQIISALEKPERALKGIVIVTPLSLLVVPLPNVNFDSNQLLSLAMQLVSVQTTKVGNQHAPEVGPCPYMGMPADDAIWSNMHSQIKLIAISRQSKYYVALSHVLKNELHNWWKCGEGKFGDPPAPDTNRIVRFLFPHSQHCMPFHFKTCDNINFSKQWKHFFFCKF